MFISPRKGLSDEPRWVHSNKLEQLILKGKIKPTDRPEDILESTDPSLAIFKEFPSKLAYYLGVAKSKIAQGDSKRKDSQFL